MHLKHFSKELLFPSKVSCIICNNEQVYKYGICKTCFDNIPHLLGNRCKICMDAINTEGLCAACLHKKPDFTKLYCAYPYAPPMGDLVKKFKSENKRYLRHCFAELAIDTVDVIDDITLIVPVPAAKSRLKARGYNQAELISKELSRLTCIPYDNVLIRLNDMKTANLKKKERSESVKDQFDFKKSVSGETILLVDDICTMGVTLRECAKVLMKAGAKEIFCYAVVRTEQKS